MGQVVLIIGEPGLGKSRLVYTLKEHVLGQMIEGEEGAPVIEWRCAPHYQNTALYPAIEFYERTLGFRPDEPPQAQFDRLLHRLEQYDLARPETMPLWASLLSLPSPDRFPPALVVPCPAEGRDVPHLAGVAAQARRPEAGPVRRRGLALGRRLHPGVPGAIPRRGPARLHPHRAHLPPEFRTPWPAVAHQTSLALNRLTRRQVGELMRKKTGSAPPEAVVEQIYDRTGGVPLFVEEFTKMAQESGVLDQEEGDSTRVKALMTREIPATLQDLVMARLDRMEGDREVAQLAAVLGREASYELLAAVADMDEQVLQAELGKLTQAEILYQKGRPPRCTFIFKHALLQTPCTTRWSKASASGSTADRRGAGGAVPADHPDAAGAARPPLHRGGPTEQAIGYWLKAGLRSRERSAESEAIGHLSRGLALLETLDESPERDARGTGNGLLRWGPPTSLRAVTPPTESAPSSRGHVSCASEWVSRRKYSPACLEAGCFTSRAAIFGGAWSWPTRGWNLPTGSGTAAL